MKFIFYDFEVFCNDWLVVLIEEDIEDFKAGLNVGQLCRVVIRNNPQDMMKYYELHKNDIWIGYNSNHYDQWILKGILCGIEPAVMNAWIIEMGNDGWAYSNELKKYKLNCWDCYNQVSDGGGLKGLESSLGLNIIESSVSFTIKRKLSEEEILDVIKYCTWDVLATRIVFKERFDTYETDYGVVELICEDRDKLDLTLLSKSETQLTAIMLGAKKPKIPRDDEFEFTLPQNIEIKKYKSVPDWYMNPDNRRYTVWSEEKKKYVKNQLLIDISGTPHVFGYGGVHGSLDCFSYICEDDEIIVCADFSSFYPSNLILYHNLSRNVKDPSKYKEIYKKRLKYKAEGNPKASSLKLVLNKASGGMKAETSDLYDPRMNNQMCVGCQLYLLDLAEHLEAGNLEGYQLLQSNTDAVYFKVKKSEVDAAKKICSEFMERTGYILEYLECTKLYQKDVNNYLMVTADGDIKVKGAYVKEQTSLSRDLPIVREALVRYMVDGTPVEETVKNCNSLMDFMLTTKASKKYSGVVHGDKALNERCNRVFASLRPEDEGKGIFKISCDTGKPNKFPNSPTSCFIDNGDIRGKEVPEYLDKVFYIKMCVKRLKDFGIQYVSSDGVVYEDAPKPKMRDVVWQQKYEIAKEMIEAGVVIKSSTVTSDGVRIGSWVQSQRKKLREGKFDEEKVVMLGEIGIAA